MSFSVKMPALGESVTEGTVTRWLKSEGDVVALDEPLLEVSTDKVDTEIPSPAAGVLQKIVVAVDQVAAVGAELALIADSAGAPTAPPVVATPAAPTPAAPPPPSSAQAPSAPTPTVPTPQPTSVPSTGSTIVAMPALGESVSEGTVTRWLKKVGEQVNADEPLLEVSTDKVDTEIPSPVSGTLLSIDVPVDSTVPVGARLATIGSAGSVSAPVATPAPAPSPAPTQVPTPAPAVDSRPIPKPPQTPPPIVPRPQATPSVAPVRTSVLTDVYVTPIVRKLAADNGVDLNSVRGTGIGGRIRKEDVLAAVARPISTPQPSLSTSTSVTPSASAPARPVAASPLRGTTVTMSRLRKVIASRMVESLQISAQLTTVVEVDITKIARLRERAKATFESREGVKLTFLPFFAIAACEALKQHPVVNASVDGDQITYHGAEHLGVAVDTERGLLVPVIRDAGDLNMGAIARKIADVAARTRENKITPDELGGGTFTITNTGSRGALFDTPIINQPQVAILGLGAVVKRPMVVKGEDGGETIEIGRAHV